MIPYRKGKHAYKKAKYTHRIEHTCYGKFKTCTNSQTGIKIYIRKVGK